MSLGAGVPLHQPWVSGLLIIRIIAKMLLARAVSTDTLDQQFREDANLKEECSPLSNGVAGKMLVYIATLEGNSRVLDTEPRPRLRIPVRGRTDSWTVPDRKQPRR